MESVTPACEPGFFPFGASHHATFQMQSPALTVAEFSSFMVAQCRDMAANAFNTFSLNVSWADVEPQRDRWDFAWVDAAFEAAAASGQRVILWLWPELAPAWAGKLCPSACAEAASGYRSQMLSSAHPFTRGRVSEFLRRAVDRYRERRQLLAYNVSVEAGLWWTQHADSDDYEDRLWDYSRSMIVAFRAWVAAKYGSIDEINRVYRTGFQSVDELDPPRGRFFTRQAMLTNQAPWLDWRLFTCDAFTDFLAFKVGVVRSADPTRPLIDHTHLVDPALSGQDLWKIAEQVDVMGMSMFTSNVAGDFMTTNWNMDRHRSAGGERPVWVMELRAGQTTWGITNWGEPLDAADVARFTWQVVGNGAKCVQYWNWAPHVGGVEVGGHGLVNRDGSPTDRSIRASSIAKSLQCPTWRDVQPHPAHIAILDSVRARIVASGEGSDDAIVAAQRTWYAALRSRGFLIDFVSEDEVADGRLSRYRLFLAPFAYVLDRRIATAIEDFVASGGFVAAGPLLGAKDEFGFGQSRIPGFGLDRLFGATESSLTPCFSDSDASTSVLKSAYNVPMTGRPSLTVESALIDDGLLARGDSVSGFKLLESFEPHADADVALRDEVGRAVAVRNGCTLLFGSLAHRDHDYADDGFARLLADFASAAGVAPDVVVRNRGSRAIEARMLDSDSDRVLVVWNCEDSEEFVRIDVDGEWSDCETGRAVDPRQLTLPAREAIALRWNR